jgi:hypothetical protein
MLKRLFWLLLGAGFGFGVSFWLVRTVRQTVERYTPERLSADLASAIRDLGSDLRAAVAEGRDAMREREAQLRAEIDRAQQLDHARRLDRADPLGQARRLDGR